MIQIRCADRLELEMISMTHDARGVGVSDGMKVFIRGAVAGDRVLAEIERVKKTYAEARLIEIRRPSERRREPDCPYFHLCGGCDIMHMKQAYQMQFKRTVVRNAFERIGGVEEPDVAPCVTAGLTLHYRNKTTFFIDRNGWGLYQRHTNSLVPIKQCLLADPCTRGIMDRLYDFSRTQGDCLYSATIRTAPGGTMLVVRPRGRIDEKGLAVTFNDMTSLYLEREGAYRLLSGQSFVEERICVV